MLNSKFETDREYKTPAFRYDNWDHMTLTKLTLKSSQNNIGSYLIQLSARLRLPSFRPVVILLETGTGVGVRSDRPGPIFLSQLAQLETYKCPITTTLAPIEYTAPLLQAAAIEFATGLDFWTEEILQETSKLGNQIGISPHYMGSAYKLSDA